MNPAILFLSALLLFTPTALAVTWHNVRTTAQATVEASAPEAEMADGNTPDKEKKKKDRKLKVWSRTTHAQPKQARPGDFFYASSKSLTEINCTARTLRPIQKIYYGDDGGESKIVRYGESEKPAIVVPDSQEEWLFDFACNFKPPKATIAPPPKADTPPAEPRPTARPAEKPTASEGSPRAAPGAKTVPAEKQASPAKPGAK